MNAKTSDASGKYEITGLPVGEYTVAFSTPFNSPLDYITQYYDEKEASFDGQPVDVGAGETTTGIDAALKKGGEIEGRVTDTLDDPLRGVEVCAFGIEVVNVACAETKSDGTYLITGLPTASFTVGFHATPVSGLDYITQYYDDQESFEAANPVPVKAEKKDPGIDATMTVGGKIEGTVRVGETGEPSTETEVCAFNEGSYEEACEDTNGAGEYTIAGLASGSYTVVFLTKGYHYEFYDQVFSESEAAEVKVTAPDVVSGVNAELPTLPKRITWPQVTGTAAVGGVLTCEEGTYGGFPAPTLSVQWLRDGEAIAGATSTTYTVQAADAGHQLQCKVAATNVRGTLWVWSAGVSIPVPPPSTPPPASSVLANVTVVPAIAIASRVTTNSQHLAAVRLKCSVSACKGTLQLLLRVVSHHHASTIVLATGSFSLQAGASASVRMRLTAAGRSRLAHDAHRAVAAKLKVSLSGGATTTHAISVT